MTRTIHADLLTTQKKTAYTPSLSLSIQDNGLPHPAVALSHPMTGYSGAPSASVVAGNAIVRAHVSGGAVLVQRITDPTNSEQWTSWWTSLASGANYPALFYTGTYVVCVYQITATKAVCWKRSDDGGATWSSEKTIWTETYNLGSLVLGASGGATRSGLFYAHTTYIYFRLYDPTTDTFGAPVSLNYGDTVASFGVCHDSGNTYRLVLALGPNFDSRQNYVLAPSTYVYGTGVTATCGYVGLPTTIEQTGVPDYRSLANFHPAYVALAKVGTAFWLTFRVEPASGCALGNDIRIAVSDDGAYYSGSVKLGQASIADRLVALPWSTGTTYLACDSVLLVSTPQPTVGATLADIVRYSIQEGATGSDTTSADVASAGRGAGARLEIVLDNRSGAFDGIETDRLGNDMLLARGAVCSGTARTVAREAFVIEDVQWSRDNKRVRLTGHNYASLMRYWRADLNYYWRGQTLQVLVQAVAALGGVQAVSFDASSFWSTTVPEFTLPPGQSALEAMQALQQQFQFVYRVSSSGAMSCFALSDSPAADYVFGTATNEHPTLRARDSSKRQLPEVTHVVVLGEDEHGAESLLPIQTEAGFQRTRVVTRQYLDSTAACAAQALALAAKAEAVESQAVLYCLPAFHLELWDAVQSDGWEADQVRYVTAIQEIYNTDRADPKGGQLTNPLYQVLTLADVDVTLAATGGGLPSPTGLSHAYADDGHHLAWFYPGKLTDVLYFEVVRNTDDAIDGNETLVYRGQNLQAIAAYSDTAGDYFAVRAVGHGETASSWVWGGPYIAQQITMEDDFRRYMRPDISDLESLSALALADFEADEAWTMGTADTTHVTEGARGYKCGSGDEVELTVDLDMSDEQRFTDADFVGVDGYATGAVADSYLVFKTGAGPDNYTFAGALAAGWNHFKAKRGTATTTGSPDWATIIALTLGLSDSGADVTFDHLWISKADPDNPDTYNDTGIVWDFLPLQGTTSEWHVLPGKKSGMPSHDYVMAQLRRASTPANWLLGWNTQADVAAGVAVTGMWLRDEGQAALAFCIQDSTVATRTLYAAEVDTAANKVRFVSHVAGERTVIDERPFVCAPGQEIFVGADFRDATRINVYASTSQSNLLQASNLLISVVDSTILRGGAVGLMAFDCVVYFFAVRAGSPRHVDKAEWAALAEQALSAAEADHAATADTATTAETAQAVDLDGAADALVLDGDGDTTISAPTDDQIDFEVSGVDQMRLTAAGLLLNSGVSVSEFSSDTSLAGNSDSAVPTEKAVKTYIDGRWVWLTTPLESTSWDGDAYAAGAAIDLSAAFGLPAGIKAVVAMLQVKDETLGVVSGLGPNSTYWYALITNTIVVNQYCGVGGVVPCDANGDIYFGTAGEVDAVFIRIWGYCV